MHFMASGERKYNVMLLAPDLGYGGAERSFAKLTHLLSRKYYVHAVVFNEEIKQVYLITGTLLSLDVRSRNSILGRLLSVMQRTLRLRTLKRELKIDVCISFLEGADYINVLSKQKERTILSVRGSKRYDKNITGFSGWIRRNILLPGVYKNADAIISVSNGLQQELVEDYKINTERAETIYNYYNFAEMEALAAKPVDEDLARLLKENKCLVTVGRLASEKGFQQVLHVFERLLKKDNGLKLLFIGEGELDMELKKICAETRLSWQDYKRNVVLDFNNDVFFLGYQSDPLPIVSKSFLFLLPSLTEGFPNVLVEAMAAGVPVVAADCPHGPKEILESNSLSLNGVLLPCFFSYNDSGNQFLYDHWASAISSIISNPELREKFIASAKQRIHDFTEEEALKKWSSWIEPA
jgi:glycosyltransferase involved in cell wall biosynthesis